MKRFIGIRTRQAFPIKSFHVLLVLSFLAGSLQTSAVAAAGSSCVSSGPLSGTYTVNVCITVPADGAVLSGAEMVTSTANVTGSNPGVSKLIFYLDGQYLLTDFQNTHTFQLPSQKWVDGSKLLEVEALMKDGFTSQRASITVTFDNGISQPPVNTNSFTPTSGTNPLPGHPFTLVATGDGAGGEVNADNVINLISSWNPNLFLYLGDVYEDGSFAEFYNWYGVNGAKFGQFRAITDPVIGNHEYQSGGVAPGYFDYWDNAPRYYSYNAAGWHIIALDSNCGLMNFCDPGEAEYQWLANDLSTHSNGCTMAYFHHPVFNIGSEGYGTAVNPLWSLLAQHGVDIVLTGHDHTYQRWQPLDANGNPSASGITQFVVGGGGHGIQHFVTTDPRLMVGYDDTAPNTFGALRMEMNSQGAAYQYINTSGQILDHGSVQCSGTPTDGTPPTPPANVSASSSTSELVTLTWTPAMDNVGVVQYEVYRDGNLLATMPFATSYLDTTVLPSTTYSYQLRARDEAGNISSLSTAAQITTPALLLSDGFENGDLAQWTNVTNLPVQQTQVYAGQYAVRGTSTGSPTYAYKTLSRERFELYYRLFVKIISQGGNSIYLQRYRTSANGAIFGLFISSTGKLGYRNDVTALSTTSATTVTSGVWHEIQVHLVINGDSGSTEVWLDNTLIPALSKTENLGNLPIGLIQLGDNSSGRTYDIAMDRVAISTDFINSTVPQEGAPLAQDQSVSTAEDTTKDITLVATDPTGPLNYQIVTAPAHGILTGAPPDVTYTPALNYNGTDSFTFEATNGTVHSNTASVSLNVSPVNDPPTGINLSTPNVDENLPVGTTVSVINTVDPDPGDSFSYQFCGGMDDTYFQISGNELRTGIIFDYEAKNSYSVCIHSTDNGSLSLNRTLTVSINNVMDTSTFVDVPMSYWAWQYIETLYDVKITGGCGTSPLVYCPDSPVTRAQMAVFILRSKHGSTYTPPAAQGTVFDDVPASHWAAAWIERLAAEGITGGCGGGRYCPETVVTRDQMAIFLLRAKHGSSYQPPDATGTLFGDIPASYWAASWVERLVTEGITAGCGNGLYCPTTPVTRDQMAVFLVKTFSLP